MPRPLNKNSCNTCRRRKIKCTAETPICQQCAKAERYCDRSQASPDFHPWAADSAGKRAASANGDGEPPDDPRAALENQHLARLFTHYIARLANWYDLSDAARNFEVTVPLVALDEPLLFCAVIALSAMHMSKTAAPKLRETAEHYHGFCIKLLIKLEEGDALTSNGMALASVCLLRAYEILDGDTDPNRHLRGAYSLASRMYDLSSNSLRYGLLAAGFWNYLREDITYSLFKGCPLKMNLDGLSPVFAHETDQHYLNSASLVLGKLINSAFDHPLTVPEWEDAFTSARDWAANLPAHILPISVAADRRSGSTRPLPLVSFLLPCHTAVIHYFLVALFILAEHAPPGRLGEILELDPFEGKDDVSPDGLPERWALYICGSAYHDLYPVPTVLVNAFGPIAYCARRIRDESSRQELVRQLAACKPIIGWPVDRLRDDLLETWHASDR